MKVYCFYLVKNKISPEKYKGITRGEIFNTGDNDCVLYAFTPEKDSEKFFISTRNMKLFFEKKLELDREEYIDFCEEHPSQLYEYHSLTTKVLACGRYIPSNLRMLCTEAESDNILYYKEELIMDIISNILNDDMLIIIQSIVFKSKIITALNDIFLFDELVNRIHPLEDINYDIAMIDELALYVKLYSNTFNKKDVIK